MGGDARPGNDRQFRDQTRQFANDAQDLRRTLQQNGGTQQDLQAIDEVLKALRALEGTKANSDPRGLEQLVSTATDRMKKLDLDLRKRVDKTSDQMLLSGAEDAPPKYRPLVDDYFKSLSKKGSGGTAPAPAPAPKGKGGK
jgi:hypothetical protein